MYQDVIKPSLDFLVALIAFIILSPVFIIVTVMLAIANGGYPFFFQLRPGKNTRIFKVIKFKTMNDKHDAEGNLLPDDVRLTRIGKFVRKTSIDEIPQLLNVVAGHMSIVGPRPLLIEYLNLYNADQMRRHEVRPGITGWAQVNGRNTLSWKKKFEYDIYYVDHISFWLDITIIFKTIVKVLKAEGISAEGMATAEKFNGKN